MVGSSALLVSLFCLHNQLAAPPYIPKDLKENYRKSYDKGYAHRFFKKTKGKKVLYGSEVKKMDGKKFLMTEIIGITKKSMDRIWSVMRNGERFDEFLPFFKEMTLVRKHPKRGDLYKVVVGLFGFGARFWLEVRDCKITPHHRELEFAIRNGALTGTEGRMVVRKWKPPPGTGLGSGRYLVYMESHWLAKKLGIPTAILEWGLNAALQRIGGAMLREIERG